MKNMDRSTKYFSSIAGLKNENLTRLLQCNGFKGISNPKKTTVQIGKVGFCFKDPSKHPHEKEGYRE